MRSPVFALDDTFGSAFSHGQRIGRRTLRSLVIWITIAMAAVALVTVVVTSAIFHYSSVDEQMIAKIGALVGQSADGIDVEFAINPSHDLQSTGSGESGIFSVIPTNIFAALSSNDSVRVLIFALIFGIGMVRTERQSGHSIFGALRHPGRLHHDF
jgi:Na+/H+-dicarboxylate symporter